MSKVQQKHTLSRLEVIRVLLDIGEIFFNLFFIFYIMTCRFRLCVIVEDSSGSAAVILRDREVYRIVKKNVYDVVGDQEKVHLLKF